jgi:hypothetical protein
MLQGYFACGRFDVMLGRMTRIQALFLALLMGFAVCAKFTPAQAQTPKTQAEADAMMEAQEAAKRAEAAKEAKAKAPPPAIPGAESGGAIAPSDKLANDMAPNDALFDAINRGDAAAARDALNRGAQLDARNVLGQTPIDASIDSNRTDITFLLLSMRGASPSAAHRPEATLAALHKSHAAPARPARNNVAHLQARADPGTPKPAVGFIGF